jgi:hypothetical protein
MYFIQMFDIFIIHFFFIHFVQLQYLPHQLNPSYYLFKNELKDLNDTFKYLSMSVPDYNKKPHGRLFGLTPNEVLNGSEPAKDNYQNDIAEARKKRLLQNQSIECCQSN